MKPDNHHKEKEEDAQASSRKEDHISMAFESATAVCEADKRFYYEPILQGHPNTALDLSTNLAQKTLKYPVWVSSMTGGTAKAKTINHNLAKLCGVYGLGMGLGSCRQLLHDDKRLSEFDVKHLMPDSPLMTNLGIAQVETLIKDNDLHLIEKLNDKLSADGLIIHVNPLQEWMQPEGDKINHPPIDTIKTLLAEVDYPVIVKEVGQGFGPRSIALLLGLELEALDLAGFGGTNFSKLELLRSDQVRYDSYKGVYNLGHTCEEMIDFINDIYKKNKSHVKCKKVIISGGIKTFLDGYYHMQLCPLPSIYAQASAFLKNALDYDQLCAYTELQIEGLEMAHALLTVKHR